MPEFFTISFWDTKINRNIIISVERLEILQLQN